MSASAAAVDRRALISGFLNQSHKAMHRWGTPAFLRLAYAGCCPICGRTFPLGLDAVEDAWRHLRVSAVCRRALLEQIDQPAWAADQAQLRRRGESTGWAGSVRRARCARCRESFVSVWPRRYCRAPLCEQVGAHARKVRWQKMHPRTTSAVPRVCGSCGHPFSARRRDAVFCSASCRQRAHRHASTEHPVERRFREAVTQEFVPPETLE
jgi:hypothetical protein